jgi:hypothetical protein
MDINSQLFQNHGYKNVACLAVIQIRQVVHTPATPCCLCHNVATAGNGKESDDQLLAAFVHVVNENDCLLCRSNGTLSVVTGTKPPSHAALRFCVGFRTVSPRHACYRSLWNGLAFADHSILVQTRLYVCGKKGSEKHTSALPGPASGTSSPRAWNHGCSRQPANVV